MQTALLSISPIDGRYSKTTEILQNYFSEFALFRYRVKVEIEYFIALCDFNLSQLPQLSETQKSNLRIIYSDFNIANALHIKEIEKTTNHDIKAVEYFIKEQFEKLNLTDYKEFIHFGLTSQDINNTAIPISILEALDHVYFPKIAEILTKLIEKETLWNQIPLLAHTHGQPASPTRLGKEIKVFIERLEQQISSLQSIPYAAKFGGATGNLNAHKVAFPEKDWKQFAHHFVENILGLRHSFPTTQIEHYDHLAAQFDALKRINTILIDFSRDVWQYISMGYFKQKIKEGEVGSSAMPHKVNPIDFENAEGNLGLANAVFEHLSAKLPISRLQRDLTDSTVLRNIGIPIGYTLIAMQSLVKGLDKLIVNELKIEQDLEDNWMVVAEGIQTILRRENYPNPYEALKALTRTNEKITKTILHQFIDNLPINDKIKTELKQITPFNYTGI